MEIIGFFVAVIAFIICAAIWLIPIILIAGSTKTTGGEKAAWLIAVIFVSWFAWVFYWLLAPIKERGYGRRDYDY